MAVASWAQNLNALQFIQNKNQWDEGIDFSAKVPGGAVYISSKGFSVYLVDQEKLDQDHLNGHEHRNESDGKLAEEPTRGHYFQINFLGANLRAKPIPMQKGSGYYNYFLGSDSCRWAGSVPAYEDLMYADTYPGIDLKVSSSGKNLKYDFIVKAGVDPNQIQIEYCGVDGLEKNDGDLIIKTSLGILTEKKPIVYQIIDGRRTSVLSEYSLTGHTLSFSFPDGYDPCYDLVIDPLLIFSTYSGSTADNWGSTATPGEHGTVYSAGVTNRHIGTNIEGGQFPATPGAFQTTYGGKYDIAIIKYDSVGTRFLYATFLGGNQNESPHSLLVDSLTQDLIMLGTTSSINYPVNSNAYDLSFNFGQPVETGVIPYDLGSDIVISRLNRFGNLLIGSTFIGGNLNDGLNVLPSGKTSLTANYGDQMRGDVITDAQGYIYISSVTSSTNFPVTASFGNTYHGGGTDGVVMKLSPNLSSIIWSGFIGGFGFDAAYSIKFDRGNNILVAGGTNSGDFPVTPGAYQTVLGGSADGWLARLLPDGSAIVQSTFTGTIAYDQVYFIDQNKAGEIFCFGQTSGLMPVTPGVYTNPNSGQFLQKFSSDLSTLKLSTVFGSGIGIPNISPTAFLVNECDNIFMSGWGGNANSGYWSTASNTSGMPITPDAIQPITHGSDFYFIVLNSDASELKYATFLGGPFSHTHVDGGTSRFDKFGIVYHAVCAGCGGFSDFPTTQGVRSNVNRSQNCNNAAFKFDLSSLRARFQTNTVKFDMPGFDGACYPDSIRFQNKSTGGENFIWDLGDGTIITKSKTDTASIIHQFQEEGIYYVKLVAIDYNTCRAVDSVTRAVHYYKDVIEVDDDAVVCEGSSHQLVASGGTIYSWTSDVSNFKSTDASPSIQPEEPANYFVSITDSDGCSKQDTISIGVVPSIDLVWDYDFITDCLSRPFIHVTNETKTVGDEILYFDFGDGTTSDNQATNHDFEKDSLYTVKLVGVREFCVYEKSVDIPIFTLFVPNVITPSASANYNDKLMIGFGAQGNTPADEGIPVSITIVDRWGKKIFESSNYQNDWDASSVEGGIYYLDLKLGNLASCKSWLHVVK
jgi:hypothetical protein